jgi:hypothetical protein
MRHTVSRGAAVSLASGARAPKVAWKPRGRRSRPPLSAEVRELLLRLARQNPGGNRPVARQERGHFRARLVTSAAEA